MGKHRAGTERAQQAERTRERLVEVACRLFALDGFVATSMDAIAEAAGVTKGALYHHFSDKRSVYTACYHHAHAHLARTIEAIRLDGRGRDPLDVFIDGAVLFLRSVVTDPWMVRLTVAEGPVALGHADWVALDNGFAWTTMGRHLARMQAHGIVLDNIDVDTLTSLINAAINEAAMSIVRADDREAAFVRTEPVIRAMLAGLRPPASN